MRQPIGLLCTSHACGGLELNVLRMAEWFARAGRSVVIIGKPGSDIAKRAAAANIPFSSAFPRFRIFRLFSFLTLCSLARRLRLSVIIVNATRDMGQAVLAKILTLGKVRLIYVQHMQIGVDKKDLYHTWQYNRLDAWISPLPVLFRQVLEKTNMRAARIHEIPFGIVLENFIEEKPAKIEARLLLNLPTDAIIAGVIGRLDPQKNQALLLEAAAPIIRSGVNLKILIVGGETLNEDLKYGKVLSELSFRLGIAGSVYFRPFRDDVATAYAALDIFAMTSQSESYGMVTIEAMAAALPVIATRSGGTPELVDDKKTGFLIEPASTAELESALRLLIEIPDLREVFGKAGRRKVIAEYSHLRQITELNALVRQIA